MDGHCTTIGQQFKGVFDIIKCEDCIYYRKYISFMKFETSNETRMVVVHDNNTLH